MRSYIIEGKKEGIQIRGAREGLTPTKGYKINWHIWKESYATNKRTFYRQREKLIKLISGYQADTTNELRAFLIGTCRGAEIDIMEHLGFFEIIQEFRIAEKIIQNEIEKGI